jgi:hypothetical protein
VPRKPSQSPLIGWLIIFLYKCGIMTKYYVDTKQIISENELILTLDLGDINCNFGWWQERCRELYGELHKALPEKTVSPFEQNVLNTFDSITFDNIILDDFVIEHCANIFFKVLNNWILYYNSTYKEDVFIKIGFYHGIKITIPYKCISKLLEYSNKNPNLTICEVLNYIK